MRCVVVYEKGRQESAEEDRMTLENAERELLVLREKIEALALKLDTETSKLHGRERATLERVAKEVRALLT